VGAMSQKGSVPRSQPRRLRREPLGCARDDARGDVGGDSEAIGAETLCVYELEITLSPRYAICAYRAESAYELTGCITGLYPARQFAVGRGA
jgi:hypothetical protein